METSQTCLFAAERLVQPPPSSQAHVLVLLNQSGTSELKIQTLI